MPWLSISAVVDADAADRLSDALLEAGAISVEVTDAAAGTPQEQPIFDEPGSLGAVGWARSRVSALFAAEVNAEARLREACAAVDVTPLTACEVARVDDQDWVRATQAQFGPQRVSARLWIVPSWHEPPDPSAINVLLDPGLAFGTGSHPTTRLCLRWLKATIRGGETVLDFGCGSGILAVAAMKLGAGAASGVDIDPQSVLAARRNAVQNRVVVDFHSAAERVERPADIVVANILAHPLIVLAPLLGALTAPAGKIALSGILREQAEEVAAAYAPLYVLSPPVEEDGWVLLVGARRGRAEAEGRS